MTVSRVLAGQSTVKPGTREKVLEAAKHLNYELNALAQNLNLDRSGFIGVATPFGGLLGSSYFEEAFKGFRRALADTGLDFALFDTTSEACNDGAKLARLYRQRRVDGLLVVAAHTDDRFLDTLGAAGVPMVVVGEQPRGWSVCSISCDDRNGIDLLCRHLYSLGHRRIAFVEGPRDFATAERRKAAYVDFCRENGLNNPSFYLHPGDFAMRSGRAAGMFLLRAEPRPTAIIAANDMMAFGLIESARELGLRVPRDVSVAGFDDLPAAAERFPSLTTVHQPVIEMAEHGGRTLLHAINTSEMPAGQTVLDVSLVVRESTAPSREF